jgi:hypothetical protein
MDFSNTLLIQVGLALALPIFVLAMLNWLWRKQGGLAKGWAGAIFLSLCMVAALAIIVARLA